jgi:hypothetical protein
VTDITPKNTANSKIQKIELLMIAVTLFVVNASSLFLFTSEIPQDLNSVKWGVFLGGNLCSALAYYIFSRIAQSKN